MEIIKDAAKVDANVDSSISVLHISKNYGSTPAREHSTAYARNADAVLAATTLAATSRTPEHS